MRSASNFATIHSDLSAALNLRFRKSGDGCVGLICGAYTMLEGLHGDKGVRGHEFSSLVVGDCALRLNTKAWV